MPKRYQGGSGRFTWLDAPQQPPAPPPPLRASPGRGFPPLPFRLLPAELETEDLILLLICYLLYRESGDSEWLVALGALLLS
ncbi:MAG: hypothetical protein K6G17_09010 [Oscillospiraceae bacterium]|nr:hypothetical protein [Oscillospiraceae bacterium]